MHPTPSILNDYVDDDLAPAERAQVVSHLAACRDCRTLVAELDGVKRAAAGLGTVDPPSRIWVALDQERKRERLDPWTFQSATWPLATAAALLLATAVGLRVGQPPPAAGTSSGASIATAAALTTDDVEFQRAESDYQAAIRDLEPAEAAAREELDPQTADEVQAGLAVIDAAIGESRAALSAEPQSGLAQQSLLDGLKTKVSLLQTLQTTTDLIAATGRKQG